MGEAQAPDLGNEGNTPDISWHEHYEKNLTFCTVWDVLSLLVICRCRYLAGAGGGEVRRQRSVLKVGPAQRTYENRQACELGPGRGVSADLDHLEAGRRRSKEGQFHRH